MSPHPGRLTVSDWEAEATRRRGPRADAPDAGLLDSLRQRFREISARIREHRQAAWIGRPAYLPLRKLSDQTLELTRIAHHDVTQYDIADAAVMPLELLDRLLAEEKLRLGEIDTQLSWIRATLFLAELVRPVMDALRESPNVSAIRLEPVLELLISTQSSFPKSPRPRFGEEGQGEGASASREFQSPHPNPLPFEGRGDNPEIAAQPPVDLLSIIPWPGLSLEKIFEAEGWPHPWFYTSALPRAQWTAAIQGTWPETLAYPRETLVAAALLADCGLVHLAGKESSSGQRPPASSSAEYRRHPEIGAALVAGIENASAQWSILVGQHHERLDGTGFPRRLKDRELSPAARGLTVIARWTELLSQPSSSATLFDVVAGAATTLWRETLRGAFDAKFVTPLFAAIQPGLPAAVKDAVRSGTKLVLHPPQPLAGPHQKIVAPKAAAETVAVQRLIDPPHATPPAPKTRTEPAPKARIASAKRTPRRAPPPRPARLGN